jgi:hypothetical protein
MHVNLGTMSQDFAPKQYFDHCAIIQGCGVLAGVYFCCSNDRFLYAFWSEIPSPKSSLAGSAKTAPKDPSRFANRDKRSHVLGERGWSRAYERSIYCIISTKCS